MEEVKKAIAWLAQIDELLNNEYYMNSVGDVKTKIEIHKTVKRVINNSIKELSSAIKEG